MLLSALLTGCAGSSLDSGSAPLSQGEKSAFVTTNEDTSALTKVANAYAAQNTTSSATYKIGAFDVVEVTVFQVPELSKTMQVSEAGTINYPLIGEVPVAGKSAREVERTLTSNLGAKYLKDPQVSVFVREYNSQRVTIEGAVARPGIYPIQGSLTLLQVMALAGGLDPVAEDTLVIFRTKDGRRSAARFNVSQVQGGTIEDPRLEAGDMIVAGKSAFKEGFNNVLKALPLAAVFSMI